MKANAAVAVNRKGRLLGFLSLMVLLVSGFAGGAETKFPPVQPVQDGTKWNWVELGRATNKDVEKSREWLFPAEPTSSVDARKFVQEFVSKDGKSANQFVALTEGLIESLKSIYKKNDLSAEDKAKADDKIFSSIRALDQDIFGRHSVKGKDGKWSTESNKAGLDLVFLAIEKLINDDPAKFADKDIESILKQIFKDESILKMLGLLGDKPVDEKKDEETEKKDDKDEKAKDQPPVVSNPPVTAPVTPPAFPREQPPVGCIPQNNGNDAIMRFLMDNLANIGKQNAGPQVDPNLAALADRVAPEDKREATPLNTNPTSTQQPLQNQRPESALSEPLARDPQQPQEESPFIPPAPPMDTQTVKPEYRKATENGDAELANVKSGLSTAERLAKSLGGELTNPMLQAAAWMLPNGAFNPVAFFQGFGRLSELAYKARAKSTSLASDAKIARERAEAIKKEIESLSPENAIMEQSKAREQELETNVKSTQSYIDKLSGMAKSAIGNARATLEQAIASYSERLATAKEALTAQKKLRAEGDRNYETVEIKRLKANQQELLTQAAKAESESEALEEQANQFKTRAEQAQSQYMGSLMPQQAGGSVKNAQKLLGLGGGTTTSNRRVGIGSAQGAANASIRGRLGPAGL